MLELAGLAVGAAALALEALAVASKAAAPCERPRSLNPLQPAPSTSALVPQAADGGVDGVACYVRVHVRHPIARDVFRNIDTLLPSGVPRIDDDDDTILVDACVASVIAGAQYEQAFGCGSNDVTSWPTTGGA